MALASLAEVENTSPQPTRSGRTFGFDQRRPLADGEKASISPTAVNFFSLSNTADFGIHRLIPIPFSRLSGSLTGPARSGKAPVSLLRVYLPLRFVHGPLRTTLPPLAANSTFLGGDDRLFSPSRASSFLRLTCTPGMVYYQSDLR